MRACRPGRSRARRCARSPAWPPWCRARRCSPAGPAPGRAARPWRTPAPSRPRRCWPRTRGRSASTAPARRPGSRAQRGARRRPGCTGQPRRSPGSARSLRVAAGRASRSSSSSRRPRAARSPSSWSVAWSIAMRLADIDYQLAPERIAQQPIEPRDAARLLVDRGSAAPEHRHVRDLPELLGEGDLVVVNDSKVIPARLQLQRDSGGAAEVLLAGGEPAVEVGGRTEAGDTFTVTVLGEDDPLVTLDRLGQMPLPP